MKNLQVPLLILVVFLLTFTTGKAVYDLINEGRPVIVQRRVMHPKQFRDEHRRAPEYRPPPFKTYKPADFQQMGVLTGDDGQLLPLYGKPNEAHRTRWNYYSSTPGNQIYSLPIKHKDRECDDPHLGCEELMGGEEVNVLGIGDVKVNMYKNRIM